MPIDTKCPHCRKVYTVRDEFAGKPIKCNNPDCQGAFTVPNRISTGNPPGVGPPPQPKAGGETPSPMPKLSPTPANGTATPQPSKALPQNPANGKVPVAKKAPPRPPADAEKIASEAFFDGEAGGADGPKTVEMTCAMCEHKWPEAWEKQGKNVICPECRHRQKVPVIKKEDWRTQNLPEGAKTEDVPDDVMTTKNAGYVSGKSLEEAGVIFEEYEPRPIWQYFAGAAAALAGVAVVWFTVASMKRGGEEQLQTDWMTEAQKSLEAQTEALKAEYPLYKAALDLAAAEWALGLNEPEHTSGATARFASARHELGNVVTSTDERDALFAVLLASQVSLGGDEQQVQEQIRLDWKEQAKNQSKPRLKGSLSHVQKELQQTLARMKAVNAKSDVRLAAVRQATRELYRRGQPDLLVAVLGGNGFELSEVADAEAQMLLEVFRETKDADLVLRHAQTLDLPAARPAPPSAVALQKALGRDEFKPYQTTITEPSKNPKDIVRDEARAAYVPLALAQQKPDEALELAARPGSLDSRLRAIGLVAETVPDPTKAVEVAVEVLNEPRPRSGPNPPGTVLARLAAAAGKANKPDLADKLAAAISDDGLKVWAKAETLRHRLRAVSDPKPESDTVAPVPDHPKEFKLGHAWARLALARHNAAATGVQNATTYDGWGPFKPFGLAGLALGLQDRRSGAKP